MVTRLSAILAVCLALPLSVPARDATLMLRSAPSQPIRGAHCTESGHVFAITFTGGDQQVCFQSGTASPNPVFQQGSLGTGPFESQLPLMPVHGTDLVIIQGQGTGSGGTATVVDGNGGVHYRLHPGNYPSGLESPRLALSWGVGLPLPMDENQKITAGAAKFSLGANFIEPDAAGTSLGLIFRLIGPSGNHPQPFLFVPSNSDAPGLFDNLGTRLWTFIPVPDTDGRQAVLYRTHPNGFANPQPPGFYSRPVTWEFTAEGELMGNYGSPVPIISLPSPITGGQGSLPPGAQATDIFEAAPWGGSAFLGAVLTSEGTTGAAIYDSPQALAAVQETTSSDIDCEKADLNGDGKVDGADMDLLLEYSLQSPQDLRGDLTGSGRVDSGDFEYMHKAIEKCGQGGKIASAYGPMNLVLGTGQTLPGHPSHRMNFITGVRGNGLGTGVFMVSATNEDTSQQADAVVLMDGGGVRTLVKTGDDLGHGTIAMIGDSTARRGLSQVNRHGQFTLTVALADGTHAVYRIDGMNKQPVAPPEVTPGQVVQSILKQTGATGAHDVNRDGVLDSADIVAAGD